MRSQSLAIEQAATASFSVENATGDIEKQLIEPNNVKLEAFTVRLAWAFASAVVLLILVSFLLVVADYAGSAFASDLQPKSGSSSWGR